MELTRRWFLIGTTAALAAPLLPQIVKSEPGLIRLSPRFDYRAINDFMFVSKCGRGVVPFRFRVFRPGTDRVLHDAMVGPGNSYRYVSFPGTEWISTSSAPLVIETEPEIGCEFISIAYNADRASAEAIQRENARVQACTACKGHGCDVRTVENANQYGDTWESEEYTDDPCPECGGVDWSVRGRHFVETFQFGPDGRVAECFPLALDPRDMDWRP